MTSAIFIEDKLQFDYTSSLFGLFSQKVTSRFLVTSSLKEIPLGVFPIFTSCSSYIEKTIKERNINNYGLIIDIRDFVYDNANIQIVLKAKFAFLLGFGADTVIFDNLKTIHRITCLYEPREHVDFGQKIVISELDSLEQVYECLLDDDQNELSTIRVLCPLKAFQKNKFEHLLCLRQKFAALNKSLIFHCPTNAEYDLLLSHAERFLGAPSPKLQYDLGRDLKSQDDEYNKAMTVDDFCDLLEVTVSQAKPQIKIQNTIINIVCYNPTYLFKDLVDRFIDKGCVHSDFPLPYAGAYIWMRPQEIWHFEFLNKKIAHNEISHAYSTSFSQLGTRNFEMKYIKERSVAIHHGTCYEPIYQFCPNKLAHALRSVASVVGVCEFDECYGPSANWAISDNFECVPIGFDSQLFVESLIRKDTKNRGDCLKIGFVGRAYGTRNKKLLNTSRLAEPKGYRKGGDALFEIALALKNKGIDFELHIIGNGWEDLVEQLTAHGIHLKYYTRGDKITYREYPDIYRLMDVLLITSRCEGGPVSALEGLSLGLKVVSSDVGIVRYLDKELKNKDTLFIFEYDRKWSIFDLATAVKHLENISKSLISYEDRLKTRSLIEAYTTDHWVDFIYNQAVKVSQNDGGS